MENRTAFAMMFLGAVIAASAQSPDLLSWIATISSADQAAQEGRYLDAERTLRSALEQARRLEPDLAPAATTYNNLASLYRDRRMCDEAVWAYQRSLHLWEKLGPPRDRYFLATANNLVGLYVECRNLDQAERHQRILVAPRINSVSRADPEYARALSNLGCIEFLKHHYSKARAIYQQALVITEQTSSIPSFDLAGALNNLALALVRTGESSQAIEYNGRALAVFESVGAPLHPMLVTLLMNGAHMNCMAHRCGEAEVLIQRALALSQRISGEDDPMTASVVKEYSVLLKCCNRKQEAIAMDRRAREIKARLLSPSSRQTIDIREMSGIK
ncbi:MAG TPA: tetratricopeptide repeat protein [Bryobacteraceae bacterium]|nr:tetratricopeptide repeat protein [Bryobacteraceae bacterium]